MKINHKKLMMAVAVASALTLSACNEGGGGSAATSATTTISGTAAGGAAVVGTVYVKDSLGTVKSAVIEANGHYSVDVTGMTGPFMLKAEGTVGNTHVEYYSAATKADVGGSVNVTPLTDLLVSNVAAQLAATYYNNPANFSGITADKLAAAETALQAKLQPILTAMGLDASIDLLRVSFATDHAGLDGVMDLIKIEPDTNSPNTLNIINKLTNAIIASDDVAASGDDATVTTISSTDLTAMASTKTDLQLVVALLTNFSTKFATGVPSEASLATDFDTSLFLQGGGTFHQKYSDFNDAALVGITFSNVAITPVVGNSNRIALNFVANILNSSEPKNVIKWFADKSTGSWKLIGNQEIVEEDMHAESALRTEISTNLTTSQVANQSRIENGLNVWINPSAYNATHNAVIHHAIVTGPGLPSSGVAMTQGTNSQLVTHVAASAGAYETNTILACDSPSAPTDCVTVAGTADNSKYTVKLYDINNNVLNGAGYEMFLPKKPLVTSSLTTAMFPEIQSVSVNSAAFVSLAQLTAGSNIAVSWTLPAGLKSNKLDLYAGGQGLDLHEGKDLLATDLSKIFPVPSNVSTPSSYVGTYAGIWLRTFDADGRAFVRDRNINFY